MSEQERRVRDSLPEPELAELDRELRAIRFRERASFASELEHRLRRSNLAEPKRARVAPAAAMLAAIGLGLLQLGDGRWPPLQEPDGMASRPLLICSDAEAVGDACTGRGEATKPEPALYLAVNRVGTVLEVERRQRSSSSPVGYSQAAFACAFDSERALCGPPAVVASTGLGLRVSRGPFLYRDICCASSARGGAGREGVLTISGLRDAVAFVFLYHDVNADGRLSPGDRLRLRMHPLGPTPRLPLYASRDDSTGRGGAPTTSPERPMSVVLY